MTGLILAAAIAAPPQAPKPPQAPPVEQKPMCICGSDKCKCPTGECPGKCPAKALSHPTCAKGNTSGACDCEKSFPLNPNPGPCKCDNCAARCFPLGNGVANGSPPAGYPAAPDGYEWRRDDRGPDGWGLFQVAPTASVTSPQRAAPVTQYGWRQVCTGNGCRLVYGPLP